ncbi:MAG: HEPN domain-containing protein [Proteobacteria bacterium]|nr:HEPN domain-containing protein [Pseudomonadota bacterium]
MKKKKNYSRQDGFSESELLHWATDHLASAKILFKANYRCYDSAGYLSHLGVELVLKAILLNQRNEFPNEHSLAKLSNLIVNSGVKLKYTIGHEETLKTLDGFYELRYPKAVNPIEIGDDDWSNIDALFEHLILILPDKIQQDLRQINHTEKGDRILMRWKKNI